MASLKISGSNVLIREGNYVDVRCTPYQTIIFNSISVYGYVVDSGGECKISARVYTNPSNPENSTLGEVTTISDITNVYNAYIGDVPTNGASEIVEAGTTLYVRIRVNESGSNSDLQVYEMYLNYTTVENFNGYFSSTASDSNILPYGETKNYTFNFITTAGNFDRLECALGNSTQIVESSSANFNIHTDYKGEVASITIVAYGYDSTNTTLSSLSKSYTFTSPGDLTGSITTRVSSSYYNNVDTCFLLPGEDYTVSWNAVSNNNNYTSQYTPYLDNISQGIITNRSLTVTNSKLENIVQNWRVDGLSKYYNNILTSNIVECYNLTINSQTSIINDNSGMIEGSANLTWEKPELIVADNLKNNFSYTYTLKYQTSNDKITWSNAENIAVNIGTNSYTISDVSTYNFAGKFINFIIVTDVYYNNKLLKTISTPEWASDNINLIDNLIKYAGKKPNQLNYITFDDTNLKNEVFELTYQYDGNNYEWLEGDLPFKYFSKNTILTVGFNELVEGYEHHAVKITWKKNKIENSKEYKTINKEDTTLSISFNDEELFTEEFWGNGTLIFTITSAGYLSSIDTYVLEEEQGYFYKGSRFQTIKKPSIKNIGNISPINKIIPVNFSIGNQEPIVDEISNTYEDLRLINIQTSHPQDIDIYGYKVYGSINDNWPDDWKQTKLIFDELFKASYGGSYKEGMFIPTWEQGIDGTYIPIVNLELGILNENKNKHLTSLLGSEISEYTEKLNVNYRLVVVDVYGQESENYYTYNFSYDCRKPAIFNNILTISSPTTIETDTIIPYTDSINTIPVFNGDNLIVKFYPAINSRHYNNNQSNYIVNEDKIYLKYASDNSIIDPNYYSVYKFVKQSTGELKSYLIDIIQPFLINSPVIKGSEDINGEYALYYLYQLNFKLNEDNIDEIEYFQIVPFYNEENEVTRTSRVYYYDDNSNGFNICYNGNNAIFWNSRIDKPKVQVTGIERIAITKDNFGFILPKLKIYVTDWGTTHQFAAGEKLDKDKLIEFNRLTDLTYSIKYYKENIAEDGTVTGVELPNISWSRNYLTNSKQMMDYDTLAAEYIDYYDNFNTMKEALEGEYIIEYEGVEGTTNLPVVTSGTTLYINLPSPIKGTEESSTNFFAYLTITGNVRRVKVNAENTASFYNYTLQLADYSIYISQNKKTFMIQQGKLGINQPDLNNIEESLYIIDKKQTTKNNDTYPNILGLELDRIFNKNNGTTGAFIGFYDDSIKNGGERILMGSLGMGVELDENEKATYTPLVIYNEEANGASIKVKLTPEAGAGIKIEGDYNNVISHKNSVEALETISLAKISYDSEGHVTGKEDVDGTELREMSRIAYDVSSPEEEYFEYPLGEPQEGDIYIWIQNE